jgi:hypothetical protein
VTTGLFANKTRSHRGPGRQYLAKRKSGPPRDTAKLDAFAEALAETGTVAAASKLVGVCHQRGSQMLAMIKAGLGWQAI